MKDKFTSRWNEANVEWEVYRNGEIFCHLSETDYVAFVKLFKADVVEENNNYRVVEVKITH